MVNVRDNTEVADVFHINFSLSLKGGLAAKIALFCGTAVYARSYFSSFD
jgi:hypothetical protein